MLLLSSGDFLVKLPFKDTVRVSNSLNPDDLGPNCLQEQSADDK